VQQHGLADAGVQHRDHERLAAVRETDVRDEALVRIACTTSRS
jgi:hypothetical protein